MRAKPMIFKVILTCGDEVILQATDPLKAAIMASSDRIRAKKNHHIAAIEYKGERIEMYLNLVALPE